MFNFFCNLALAIYYGSWVSYDNELIVGKFINYMSQLPIFGLFNNSTTAYYSTTTQAVNAIPDLAITIAVILSTICCIGCFFIIIKAIKKLFTCFLDF